jgi:HSP20 family protein
MITDHILDGLAESIRPASFPKVNVTPIEFINPANSGLLILAQVPGFSKDNITVKVDADNVLHLNGTRVSSETSKEKSVISEFIQRTTFTRKFRLGKEFDTQNITASVENGILQVNVRKRTDNGTKETIVVKVN